MSLKISIITPSFNQGRFIRDTIESVLNQNYENVEHIIVDGGSKDSTLEILSEYKHLIWISEPDNGPANAINKGLKMISGDIMTWLNSDDYFQKNIFNDVVEMFLKYGNDNVVIGGITFVDENKNINFEEKSLRVTREHLIHQNADLIRQPSTFFSVNAIKELGGLDESLKLVFDYDLLLKLLKMSNPIYLDKNIVFIRDYSTTLSQKFMRKQALEIFKVSRKNGANLFDGINKTILKKLIFKKI